MEWCQEYYTLGDLIVIKTVYMTSDSKQLLNALCRDIGRGGGSIYSHIPMQDLPALKKIGNWEDVKRS